MREGERRHRATNWYIKEKKQTLEESKQVIKDNVFETSIKKGVKEKKNK